MPAAALEPSGTLVEVLWGQPEQKYGIRAISVSDFSILPSLSFREPRLKTRGPVAPCFLSLPAMTLAMIFGDNSLALGSIHSSVSSCLPMTP